MALDEESARVARVATELARAGRLAEAAAQYEQMLERDPTLADAWYELAVLERTMRRYDAALASYQRALDHGVSRPEEVHVNRGVILSDCLRRDDAAAAELHAALRINPTYVPALLNLANLHEDLGRRDEALAVYEQILALDPDCHLALARYAGLVALDGPNDAILDRMRRAIADPETGAENKATLAFALGSLLDREGAYAEAFDTYAAANRWSRTSAGPRGVSYDRARQERYVDELIRAFGRPRPGDATPESTVTPIFVCGMFRSGSTLAEQVLARHPRVTAGGELDLVPMLIGARLRPYPAAAAGLSEARLDAMASEYLATIQRLYPHAEYVTDKRPDNFLHVGLIKSLLPRAKIVNTTRNPLDLCLSNYFLHLDRGMAYALDLLDIGHYYRQYVRLMTHWKALYGADILDFSYDSFVQDPRSSVARLLEFCGLEWDDRCLAGDRSERAVKTASVWQVRQPLYSTSSGRWRHYERQLAPLRDYLGDLGDPA